MPPPYAKALPFVNGANGIFCTDELQGPARARAPGYEYSQATLRYIEKRERQWGLKLFDLDRVIFPVNVRSSHWITLMVAFGKREVFVIDPADTHGVSPACLLILAHSMNLELW